MRNETNDVFVGGGKAAMVRRSRKLVCLMKSSLVHMKMVVRTVKLMIIRLSTDMSEARLLHSEKEELHTQTHWHRIVVQTTRHYT